MSDAATSKPPKGGGAKTILIGLALAAALGGGAFYVVFSGLVALPLPPANPPETADAAHAEEHAETVATGPDGAPLPLTAFAPIEPILVSLGEGQAMRQLQLTASLEVEPMQAEQVALLQPRVRDVLTTYLRAVGPDDVSDPAALLRMRAQMLRRVQVVTGEGVVRDLLVSEFVLR